MERILGLHHVSSVVKNAQENVDFYAGMLGMRLVKKTLNYDDIEEYHFYYGNHDGSTGLSTYFPISDSKEGDIGDGQVGYVTYAVNTGALDFWKERLDHFDIFNYSYERFGERYLAFSDRHGLDIELVETPLGPNSQWAFNGVQPETAIKGLYNAALFSERPAQTLSLFTDLFGYSVVAEDDEYYRLRIHEGLGGLIDIRKHTTTIGTKGHGTVHHIAFAIERGTEEAWREKLLSAGYFPTEVKNRKYFNAIYFRERGGILIELSTVTPGVTVDEPVETLGEAFIIPEHFEAQRLIIESKFMPVFVKEIDTLETYGYRNRYEYDMITKRNEIRESINAIKAFEKERPLTDDEQEQLKALRKAFIKVR
ncbi:ring-cleaving dioxygenase [Erysipelothrix sp. HDW6B]|uniref:VOC family protein n=1 Tax=Erysipelothrix TaxID=1647 RepID=UPI001358D989|nr:MULTISPECIES: VOC family protein [Erysipelothrix]QIK86752.1 ring-cleaving dioxygenase [Erysipelothrix sp. HDW6B]